MKRTVVFLFAALLVCGACVSTSGNNAAARSAGNGESELIIQRAEMPLNSGFKEHVYIDGKRKLVLANGDTGKIIVPNGDHVIHAELYTLTSEKLPFNVNSNSVKFTITPYSLQDFAIEQKETTGIVSAAPPSSAPAVPQNAAVQYGSGVEGSLARAADQLIVKIPPKTRVAIVYVTSRDEDTTEFIANELEFILVGRGVILIDRSQLDKIRQEQNLQISGQIDDAQAVSIGKMSGADFIITGAVTGTGNLRRLRLRALSTQTAQVVVAASEKY
jgi:hypothetical protein